MVTVPRLRRNQGPPLETDGILTHPEEQNKGLGKLHRLAVELDRMFLCSGLINCENNAILNIANKGIWRKYSLGCFGEMFGF